MGTPKTDLELLQKLIDFRFKASDEKMEAQTQAIQRLSEAIITAEVFNELAGDVIEANKKLGKQAERIRTLEEKVGTGKTILGLTALVVGPIAIKNLQQIFE